MRMHACIHGHMAMSMDSMHMSAFVGVRLRQGLQAIAQCLHGY